MINITNNSNIIIHLLVFFILLFGCQKEKTELKKELENLVSEWDYVLPLPSDNDSINLLAIRAEMNWYRYNYKASDSLNDLILLIDSNFYPALANKAWEPLNLNLLERAIKLAEKDTSIHKTMLEADYAYWIKKDTATAIRKFKEVYDKYPESKTVSWCLGMAYLWAGQHDKSIKCYRKSLDIDPNFPLSYEMMGWAYYMKKDYKKSIENFERSIDFGTKDKYTYEFTGKAYEKLDSLEKAKFYYALADSMKNK